MPCCTLMRFCHFHSSLLFRVKFSHFYSHHKDFTKIQVNIVNSYLQELLKKCINNSKDGPTFGQFGKNIEKVQKKTWDFHEIMPKSPKVEQLFDFSSQSLLKVTKVNAS